MLTNEAMTVLQKRYLRKNDQGQVVETPEEMFRRVASAVASAERPYGRGEAEALVWEERFLQMMSDLEFLPNSPTLMNAGRELGQLSACFVLPVEDSMEGIFETVKNTALVHKSGGGTGFSFSRLRPANDEVRSTKGVSSGPLSFMEVFNAATETIKQGGMRRGANMGILRVDHPDILEFISSKRDGHRLTNFNISVALTEKFMEAVETNQEYSLINPRSKAVAGRLNAREVFDEIVQSAWENGEPGIIFLDRINRDNPTPELGEIESTNPCGEQPLLPYESCNLGSINLAKMLKWHGGRLAVDYDRLRETVHLSVRFLDNVIDVNRFPLPMIDEMTRGNRKIGLGVMGFADMLLRMNVPYDTDEAVDTGRHLMEFINLEAHAYSEFLGGERGSFPNFPRSVHARRYAAMRNATVTTVAPTGTISIIAGCSSGIEPIFAVSYVRNVLDGTEMVEVNPIFEEVAKQRGFYSQELMTEIAQRGTVRGLDSVPEDVQAVFATAHDIVPVWHVRMQAAFQESVDNAVSKTVNFPSHATAKDVEEVYLEAHRSGCKGVTVYRDGSRLAQVLNIGSVNREAVPVKGTPRPRPGVTRGTTEKVRTGCSNLYITINEDEEGLCEVFTQMGKSGGCTASQSEAISRLISLALRSGIEPEAVIKQIKGIRCPSPAWSNGGATLSCADAIAKALERYVHEKRGGQWHPHQSKEPAGLSGHCPECPDCGHMLDFGEGCVVCRSCGFSRC
ncbi:MAG: vitamin B12-dependent ribonucleotide reductase [Dehalococcoidia bacterium]|nr:vitamin B12-dependent ribonucleotide reductase [Dehalococcoidia bacterium]